MNNMNTTIPIYKLSWLSVYCYSIEKYCFSRVWCAYTLWVFFVFVMSQLNRLDKRKQKCSVASSLHIPVFYWWIFFSPLVFNSMFDTFSFALLDSFAFNCVLHPNAHPFYLGLRSTLNVLKPVNRAISIQQQNTRQVQAAYKKNCKRSNIDIKSMAI